MNTMHPVVILGSYLWNADLLPRDEFAARMREVRAVMKAKDWDGLAVYGDCAEPGFLAWLTNVAPRMRWTLALVPASGEPTLVVPGAVRDLPITAAMTPVGDIRSWGSVGTIVTNWAASLKSGEKPVVAVHGADRMAPCTYAECMEPLGAKAGIADAGHDFEALMRKPRSREAWLLRECSGLLAKAAATFTERMRAGATPAQAALEAEKAARLAGAHDVRILLSRDDGRSLEPFTGMDFKAEASNIAYFAVRYLGYWTEALVTVSAERTRAQTAVEEALKAMVASAQPGRSRREVLAAGAKALAGLGPHLALESRIARMGLSLDESALWQASDEDALESGAVYSLRAAACDPQGFAASALLRTGNRNEILWTSPA